MADITEIAVAAWRLEKWLDNVNVERKMAAKSALRSIKKYLQEKEIEVVDLTGAKFDVGLAITVVNNESEETDEDKLLIREMVKPIIKEKGAVIQYGQVILGDEVKKPKVINVVEETPARVAVEETIAMTGELEKQSLDDESGGKGIQDISDSNSTECPADTKTDIVEKRSKIYLAWASVILLQIVIIALLGRTIGDISAVKQLSQAPETEALENESISVVDLSSFETAISNIDKRVGIINSKVDGVASSLSELNDSFTEISDYIFKEEETENTNYEEEERETENTAHETEELKSENSSDDYIHYVVKSGDTLIRICEDNKIDYFEHNQEIMELNGITDPGLIIVGQELKLPKE